MVSRDYRIIKNLDKRTIDGETSLEVKEVYYGGSGEPYLPESPTPVDETARWEVQSKIRSFDKPILLLKDGELTELDEYFED